MLFKYEVTSTGTSLHINTYWKIIYNKLPLLKCCTIYKYFFQSWYVCKAYFNFYQNEITFFLSSLFLLNFITFEISWIKYILNLLNELSIHTNLLKRTFFVSILRAWFWQISSNINLFYHMPNVHIFGKE